MNSWSSGVLVVSAAFLCYMSSLECGFVFDDHRGILTNDDLDAEKTTLFEIFQHDFWGGSMSRKESHKSYRPFTVLSYRYLNHYFYQLEPYSYHLVNVILHCIASFLFLVTCQKFFTGFSRHASVQQRSILESLLTNMWPTIAALLFAVHSVHTEAVASIVGRAEVLSCIFFLLSFLSYLKAVASIDSHGSHSPLQQTRWTWLAVCLCLSACSLLSKEQGVTILGVCAGYDVFLNWEQFWRVCFETCKSKRKRRDSEEVVVVAENVQLIESVESTEKNHINGKPGTKISSIGNGKNKKANIIESSTCNSSQIGIVVGRIVLLAITGVLLLWFRLSMNHNSEPIFKPDELRAAYHSNRSVRALSLSNIYAINMWLLLSPSSLCCDWSLGSVPLVTSLADSANVWSLLLYVSLMALVVHTMRSKRDRMLVGTGVMLLILPFLPATGLVFRVGFVVAERVLYMPSLGSCFLITVGAKRLTDRAHRVQKYVIYVFILCLLVAMGVKTHERNKDWETDLKLFESGVKVIPNNVKLRSNYGLELKEKGRADEAKQQYEAAMAVHPDYGEVHFNYGNLLSDEGSFAAAATSYEKAIVYPQMYAKTLNNLATMYFRLGRHKEAEEKYLESVQATPEQASTYNNLASLYGEAKRYKESETMFKKALKLSPTYVEAMFNLGTLYVQMGRWEEGEKELRRALDLNPHHHGANNNLKVAQHYKMKQNG